MDWNIGSDRILDWLTGGLILESVVVRIYINLVISEVCVNIIIWLSFFFVILIDRNGPKSWILKCNISKNKIIWECVLSIMHVNHWSPQLLLSLCVNMGVEIVLYSWCRFVG